MKCLYEVLGVEASVDDAAVRTAYRKLALQYHPDKNQHDPTAAEERFKEVQNAYEILSDKQERAWYDAHRDAILRSGERHQAGTAGEGLGVRPDDFVDVYSFFTSTCYSGFGDGPRGFYTVYDTLFTTLGEQEAAAAAARAERRGSSTPHRMPGFGLSGAGRREVAAFYAEWGNFTSARDFSWADEYNPASAPNRRVRRAMEQDNERKRKAARKEYNEGVRALVDFVKKRDKRVAAHAVEEAKRRQEREEAEAARREREKQERAARAAAYQAAAWAASDSSDDDIDEGDPFMEQLIWHCPVCDKHFKSEPAMANHERSRRHRELVELLRLELEAEEAELDGGPFAAAADGESQREDASDDEDGEMSTGASSGSESDVESETESESSVASEEEASTASSTASEESEMEEEDEEEDEEAMLARLMSSHASLSRASGLDSSDEDEETAEEAEVAEVEEETEEEGPPLGSSAVADSSDEDDWGAGKKAAKRKGKRGGKAGGGGGVEAPQPAPQPVPQPAPQPAPQAKGKGARKKGGSSSGAAEPIAAPESDLVCTICRTEFPSRNQLFKHIKQTGHAQLKSR